MQNLLRASLSLLASPLLLANVHAPWPRSGPGLAQIRPRSDARPLLALAPAEPRPEYLMHTLHVHSFPSLDLFS